MATRIRLQRHGRKSYAFYSIVIADSRACLLYTSYQSELTLKGSFSSEELKKSRIDMDQLQFDRAAICLNLTDMRGISEQISITLGDSVYIFEPGMDNRGIANTGVHAIANLSELKQNKKLPYEDVYKRQLLG